MLGERDQLCRLRMLIRKYVHRVLKNPASMSTESQTCARAFFIYLFIFLVVWEAPSHA